MATKKAGDADGQKLHAQVTGCDATPRGAQNEAAPLHMGYPCSSVPPLKTGAVPFEDLLDRGGVPVPVTENQSQDWSPTFDGQLDREVAQMLFDETLRDVFEECDRLLESRGRQYNGGGVRIFDYALYGEKSYVHEAWKNLLRIKSMLEQPNYGESAENPDDVLGKVCDTVNYLRFLAAVHLVHRKCRRVPPVPLRSSKCPNCGGTVRQYHTRVGDISSACQACGATFD